MKHVHYTNSKRHETRTESLGLWDTGGIDMVVLCDSCADKLSRDGNMAAAELIERGGWLLDESCDRCHHHNNDEE